MKNGIYQKLYKEHLSETYRYPIRNSEKRRLKSRKRRIMTNI